MSFNSVNIRMFIEQFLLDVKIMKLKMSKILFFPGIGNSRRHYYGKYRNETVPVLCRIDQN